MSNKNEVFEYLIAQLRQQVDNNPYKQQCEDLTHEVQSLKNQLRDASEQIKELQSELQHQIDLAAGVHRWSTAHFDEKGKVFKVERGVKSEQSGCRKEDTQECDHNWIIAPGLFIAEGHKDNVPGSRFCCECGARECDDKEYESKAGAQECKHDWVMCDVDDFQTCSKCGALA